MHVPTEGWAVIWASGVSGETMCCMSTNIGKICALERGWAA